MHYLISDSVKDYTIVDDTGKEQRYAKALVPGSFNMKLIWVSCKLKLSQL